MQRRNTWRDAQGFLGDLLSPVLEVDSPSAQLLDVQFGPKSGSLTFIARVRGKEHAFVGPLRRSALKGVFTYQGVSETIVLQKVGPNEHHGVPASSAWASREHFACALKTGAGNRMTGATSLDGTTRRIAGAGSLTAGALAVYWLIEFLRGQVSGVHATNVEINILNWLIVALAFGLVAKRRELLDRDTYAPVVLTALSAGWALRFVFKLNDRTKHDYGLAGIVTFAATFGLVGAAFLVRKRWRRGAAEPAAAANGASPRR